MSPSAQVPYFQIFVKGGGGKKTTLWTKASDTIDDIKCKLAQKNSIPVKERQQSSSFSRRSCCSRSSSCSCCGSSTI